MSRRRRGGGLLLALLAGAGCSAPAPEDASLQAWTAQMGAAATARREGDAAGAEARYRAAAALAQEDGRLRPLARALEGWARQAAGRGDLATADSLLRRILARQLDSLTTTGVPADDLLMTLGSLGDLALQRGELDRGQAYFEQILDLADEGWIELPPHRPPLALVLTGLARVYLARGDSSAARRLGSRATGLNFYARAYGLFLNKEYAEAENLFRRALAHQEQVMGPDHADVGTTLRSLAHLLELLGRTDEARQLAQRAAGLPAAMPFTLDLPDR